jgi:hypothetical protein
VAAAETASLLNWQRPCRQQPRAALIQGCPGLCIHQSLYDARPPAAWTSLRLTKNIDIVNTDAHPDTASERARNVVGDCSKGSDLQPRTGRPRRFGAGTPASSGIRGVGVAVLAGDNVRTISRSLPNSASTSSNALSITVSAGRVRSRIEVIFEQTRAGRFSGADNGESIMQRRTFLP